MDATSPPWSEERFNEIRDEFMKMIRTIGYKPKKVPFIPYSGFDGDNLDKRTEKAPWYKGWVSLNSVHGSYTLCALSCFNTTFLLHI